MTLVGSMYGGFQRSVEAALQIDPDDAPDACLYGECECDSVIPPNRGRVAEHLRHGLIPGLTTMACAEVRIGRRCETGILLQ